MDGGNAFMRARGHELSAFDLQLDAIEDKNKELDGLAEQSRQRTDKIAKLEVDIQRFQQGGCPCRLQCQYALCFPQQQNCAGRAGRVGVLRKRKSG